MPLSWQISTYLGLWLASIALAVHFMLFFRQPVLGALWVGAFISALGGAFYLTGQRMPFGPIAQGETSLSCAQAALILVLLPAWIFLLGPKVFNRWRLVAQIFVAQELLQIWWRGYGLLNSPSFGLAVLAISLPFVGPFLGAAILVTIVFQKSATAVVVLAAMTLPLAKRERLWVPILALLGLGGVAYVTQGATLWDGGNRVLAWRQAMDWFFHSNRWISGWGVGSFEALSPYIGGSNQEYFLQLHNDWLQVMFEMGVLGFVGVLGFFIYLVRRAWKQNQPRLVSALMGIGACALTYYPLRSFWSQVLILCVLREIVQDPRSRLGVAARSTMGAGEN